MEPAPSSTDGGGVAPVNSAPERRTTDAAHRAGTGSGRRPGRSLAARIALGGAVLAAFAVLIGLGTWQLQRLAWKEALIAAAEARPEMPAVAPPPPADWASFAIDDWNYRRVALTGRYGDAEAHAWTTLSAPRAGPAGGEGYFVVAPFTTGDGWSVLVNRGFVPADQKPLEARAGSAPAAGVVTIEGIIRRDDPPSAFTPAPNPDTNVWFSRDISEMAPFLGLDPATTAPYSVDLVAQETPAGGLPQAGESRIAFSNNHLGYAFTWYGLAAALLAVVGFSVFRRR